jgi:hypothetical protein
MKKLFTVIFLALFATVPSFGAGDVVIHSAKAAGQESVKAAEYSTAKAGNAARYSAAKADDAGKAVIKHLF